VKRFSPNWRRRHTLLTTLTLDLNDARTIVDAGIAEVERIGNPMNIAVADAGGCLLAFA